MSLEVGTRLGPYEVLSPLGAGGMGEVYRARDTRLGRDVAIKVLPPEFAADRDRLARFEQEARSASALEHPNVITIYDIGVSGAITYIAMQYVDGKTLRELLPGEPMATKRLLEIAAQIAEGLAKAHAVGIVHRDLKPENIMVSRDGYVKILDFGLAKLTRAESGNDSNLPTTPMPETVPGAVMGTVGYMSPEQASGKNLDFRSDQFALGTILYEMATGRRPFQRNTSAETIVAILREEPEPPAKLNPGLPAAVSWVVERCLAKEPDERYASTRDLARDLKMVQLRLSEVSAVASSRAGEPAFVAPTGRRRLAVASAAIAGVGAGAFGFWLTARIVSHRPVAPSFHRVTFQRGNIVHARFSPDGHNLVFSAAREGRPVEIFSTPIEGTESRPLGLANTDLAAVSRSGELLVLRQSSSVTIALKMGLLARAALSGGAPRDMAESVHGADWLPDGEVVAQRHIAIGRDALELPLGKALFEYDGSSPRASPDGRLIAISRATGPGSEIAVVDRNGRTIRRTNASAEGIAWNPNGELWFSRSTGQEPGLFAWAPAGTVRPVIRTGEWILHDIAPDGRLLLERVIARRSLRARTNGQSSERELSWLDGSTLAGISGDARFLLFSELYEGGARSGGVYTRATDGSPAVRLSNGTALAFSESGGWALVRGLEVPPRYSLVPSGAGEPLPLDVGNDPVLAAVFLPGPEPRVVATIGEAADRGHLELLTPAGRRKLGISTGFFDGAVAISPDGRLIAFGTGEHDVSLCDLENASCRKLALPSNTIPIQWSADARFLYLRDFGEIPAHIVRYEIATGASESWLAFGPEDPTTFFPVENMFVSRNGRDFAYDTVEVQDSSLFVVEGLK